MTAPDDAFIARLRNAAILPVVTVDAAADAVPLARALLAGGIDAIEVTLRTPAAIEAIGRIAGELPQMLVGAGTVLTPRQADQSIAAGARFLVSPGLTPALAEAALSAAAPFLPGIATASEAMVAAEHGFTAMKFFPAEASGGIPALKSLAAPLPHLRFCPTGGVDAGNARRYLATANVICVGGSWVAPAEAVRARDWARITELSREAVAGLRSPA